MALKIKTLVLVFLLLLSIPLLSGRVEGYKKANNPTHSLQEDGKHVIIMMNWRKLLVMPYAFLDYGDAEPNPRHDPRRKRSNP